MKFSRLAEADEVSIRDYARRYGVLRAVQIKPEYEREKDIELTDGAIWRLGDKRAWAYGRKEPLGLWQSLARQLRAILKINAALKGRTKNPLPSPGSPEDWEMLGGASTGRSA